jgi:glycosyltransferase involved in cell wall biosynthesis
VLAFAAAGVEPSLRTELPLVSCIMPTFNRRRFLRLALKAFNSQDYPARELIVIDDGTDPVGDLVEEARMARYVRLSARASIGEKRNRACAEARGSIIAHWDDDDWYAPGRCSRERLTSQAWKILLCSNCPRCGFGARIRTFTAGCSLVTSTAERSSIGSGFATKVYVIRRAISRKMRR